MGRGVFLVDLNKEAREVYLKIGVTLWSVVGRIIVDSSMYMTDYQSTSYST